MVGSLFYIIGLTLFFCFVCFYVIEKIAKKLYGTKNMTFRFCFRQALAMSAPFNWLTDLHFPYQIPIFLHETSLFIFHNLPLPNPLDMSLFDFLHHTCSASTVPNVWTTKQTPR